MGKLYPEVIETRCSCIYKDGKLVGRCLRCVKMGLRKYNEGYLQALDDVDSKVGKLKSESNDTALTKMFDHVIASFQKLLEEVKNERTG